MLFRPTFLRLLLLWPVLTVAFAGEPSRRPLEPRDFDGWRTVATPQLSRDGRWLAYSWMPQDADGDLVVREVAGTREIRVPVGTQPPPPAAADENQNPEAPPPRRNIRIAFTSDGRFAVASSFPAQEETARARKEKRKPEEMPRGGLLIVRLADGEVTRIADVKGFQVPARGGAWVAYQKESLPELAKEGEGEEKKPSAPDAAAPRKKGGGGGGNNAGAGAGGSSQYGSDLVLRNLEDGSERTFPAVSEYSFARDGRTLLHVVSSRKRVENGVYAVTPGDSTAPAALLSGAGRYSKLGWDREQTQVLFLSDRDTAGGPRDKVRQKVYLWKRGTPAAEELVAAGIPGWREGLVLSSNAAPSFSRDGRKVYVGAAPARANRAEGGETTAPEDKVAADIWHWRDGPLQSTQKVRAGQERNRSYRGVLDLGSRTYVQLADAELATVSLSDDGGRAIGQDDRAYRHLADYDGRFSDVYLVDTTTGARRRVLEKLRGEGGPALSWSLDGRWATYYRDRHWQLLDTATGATRAITEGVPTAFHNEEDDRPAPPSAHGAAGWTKDSASFLAYDRYDVWQLFADGRPARNLTAGYGKATRTILRVQRIEPVEEDDEERGLDPARPLTLRGESEDTRATGFLRTDFAGGRAPERLVWGDASHRYVGRAAEADALLITVSRFDTYPDVHVTNSAFSAPRRLTEGATQRAAFAWGAAELITYRNADGRPLQAAVYKPANFDPSRKYPAIVYIYERLAQNVHTFVNPAPGTSINFSWYTSNGYVVYTPDIVYETGQPGRSALRCVLPALDALLERGYVDPAAVGIQGHSWGGFQIAYMLTQTGRFRAAEAGAPVGNMTSAYSGIRWGSGLARQFQYETGQSRIGRPLHAAVENYLENSAVFHANKVTTPLLILHNDNDDAVPWQQGIELFLALRRHAKPAWLFNYNGEFHGLRRRANQKDWSMRMRQFFDYYLKGVPAPEWLEKGVPYIERDEEKERFNARPTPSGSAAGGEP